MARLFIFKATGVEYAGSVTKASAEQYAIGIDMAGQMRGGATLLMATAVVTDLADEVTPVTTTLLQSATALITVARIAEVTVRAGTSGHRYRVAFTLRDSVNRLYQEGILLVIR